MSFLDMAKQLKNMQGEMKKARTVLAAQTVIGKAGREDVVIELSGAMEVKNVKIKPDLIEKNDVSQLEKLVKEAMADSIHRAQKLASSQIGSMTGLGGKNPFGG
ncbi:YbaB/EbfC family nucleoid-associated protein [bacterium]|nr:YbaB/EbfC family nucleoid-associated protein [bacterium]